MQVDGFSLDAQKDKLRKYAEFQEMLIAGEYSDEGKSGKNVEGRPEFLKMLRDIESEKDGVSLFWYLSCLGLVAMLQMFLRLFNGCRIME